ncbi:2'-5' RNA ligase [Rhodanobacter thiooxydans]|uniref:2'-5' RNA ligase n=1 Tax=Rhodanobacter thiooxydans TaxID=416169 RepID=A0A154QJS6_9GAMM|nr:2'-5' RNA ligase [Rhodanobacter thiooxydans]EIL97438.1 2'-5' RNA ligase [Rhodanobacter thiooxydans LCS2]KZC24095.1 2'-5' RNA ligase [Rhodanobacter thiooxydans]MCW0201885.1 2'-5' RNA ligase [Rhodanobacter thiooxydans]
MEAALISTSSNPFALAAGINYFFALLPDDSARSAIAGAGERFRKSHRVSGSPVGIDNLHLTLCPMGKPERLRWPLEEALLAAAGDVRAQGFTVTLDSAMRFSVRDGQFPFVLCADGLTTAAALELRKAVAAAQSRVGLQVSGVSSFLPHVAMLHGHAVDAIEESVAAIQWQVSEFVLIRSFFGQSKYEVVGRWPLVAAAAPEPLDLLAEMASLADLADLAELPDWSDVE